MRRKKFTRVSTLYFFSIKSLNKLFYCNSLLNVQCISIFLDVLRRSIHEFLNLSARVNLRVSDYMVNSRLRRPLSDNVIIFSILFSLMSLFSLIIKIQFCLKPNGISY